MEEELIKDENIEKETTFNIGIIKALGYLLLIYLLLPIVLGLPTYFLSVLIGLTQNHILINIFKIFNEALVNTLILYIVLRLIRKKYNNNFVYKYKGFSNYKNMILISLFMIGFSFVYTNSIGLFTVNIPLPENIEAAFSELMRSPILFYISSIVFAPIFEEFIMRGIILEGLLNRYKPITAIVISSLLFGLIHLNLMQFIFATILGLILGYIYFKTKSLKLVILGHAVNNTVAIFGGGTSMLKLVIGTMLIILIIYIIKNTQVLSTT